MQDAEVVDIFWEAAHKLKDGERSEMPERKPFAGFAVEPVDGHKVYDCQHPHVEDTPGGRPGDKKPGGPGGPGGPGAPGGMEWLVYKGVNFSVRK